MTSKVGSNLKFFGKFPEIFFLSFKDYKITNNQLNVVELEYVIEFIMKKIFLLLHNIDLISKIMTFYITGVIQLFSPIIR